MSRVEAGRSVPFRPEAGLPGGCAEVVRLVVPRESEGAAAGSRVRVPARWEAAEHPPADRPEWAGRLIATGEAQPVPGGDFAGRLLGVRGAVQERIAVLWEGRAPMVEALVLARREHLDPELRDAFARSGTAHLLAISGFHVGVVAGLLLGVLRLAGLRPRPAAAAAAAGCWVYVAGIGAPDAAVRAALLLTLLAAARARGRPVVSTGALATALLLLLAWNPRNLASIGFQLSFAGTAGLVVLRRPLGDLVDDLARRWRGRPVVRGRKTRGLGDGLLKGGADGIVTGTAATLPTLPLLAWHFDRVSLLGIPATLLVAPPVAAAIPGVGAALVLSVLPGGLGTFLAGGVGLLLAAVEAAVRQCAELPGATLWVSRRALVVGTAAPGIVVILLRRFRAGRVRPRTRWFAGAGAGAAMLLLVPLVPGPRALEMHLIDVGQGDAIALRTPSDRWIVVDAGPRDERFDAGARRVVPHLRRHGARRIEALVLSHPHLDHIGGAPALLDDLPVRGVLDPSTPVPSRAWRAVLTGARAAGSSWWAARGGAGFRLDGVDVRVLHPDPAGLTGPVPADWNDLSIVLLVRYGEAAVLFTGDAGLEVEDAVLQELPRLTVLKVGHHGSRTSSGAALLDRTRPRMAVVPVGEGNRYGHPHAEVIERLRERGIAIRRSDRDGHVRLRLYRDGRVEDAGAG